MADFLKEMSKLSTAHGYWSKAKDLHKNVKTVRDAAKIDPKDITALEAFLKTTSKETQKLTKVLGARAKAAEAVAKAKFPEIETKSEVKWAAWANACHKYGPESKQAAKARSAYLSELLAYDYLLRERTSFCDILIKQSTAQIKVYKGLVDVHETTEKICVAVIQAPSTMSTAPQAKAMEILLKFRGVKGPANRIWKANQKIVAIARAEKKRQEAIKKINDVWISDLQARSIGDLVKSALSALGIAA